jgi:hypothetical protein
VQRKAQSHPDPQISFVDAAKTNRFTGDENFTNAAIPAQEPKAALWLPLY